MHARVARILDEIKQLSPAEQRELAAALPDVAWHTGERRGLTVEAVRQAIATRERIREEMLAEGAPFLSITDEIEAIARGA